MLLKQPNGKFCSCDWNFANKKFNLTEQDVIDMYIDKAKSDMDNAGSLMALVEREDITDDELKETGSTKTLDELRKYIPLRPAYQSYDSHGFTMHGKCPSCGANVQDGWGYTHDKCDTCGQLLSWK